MNGLLTLALLLGGYAGGIVFLIWVTPRDKETLPARRADVAPQVSARRSGPADAVNVPVSASAGPHPAGGRPSHQPWAGRLPRSSHG